MPAPTSFPLKHVSIRVPWHDQGWNGTVCACPKYNSSCLKLANIADKKREDKEEELKGRSLRDLDQKDFPACVTERATFMADFPFQRTHEHPYKARTPETHEHFGPTILHYPAYSAAGLPFRWMMKKMVWGDPENNIRGFTETFPLQGVDASKEPELPFTTNWIQDAENHQALLNCFWNHIKPRESLVFFYAKQVPLVEDTGQRILVGVGRVTQLGPLTEYTYTNSPEGKIRSMLWERMVHHSIRPDFADGFLLPYQEALEKSNDGTAFDPADVVAFAPEDSFDQFSYATEHVANDTAISSLLACRKALRRASELFEYSIHKQEAWIDKELGRLWKKRGIYPGLGAVLNAIGVPMGNFIAQEIADKAGDNADPTPTLELMFDKPERVLSKELTFHIDQTVSKAWKRMPEERKQFLLLLSRIELSAEQAMFLAIPEVRAERGLDLDDQAFLRNPYLIYEASRLTFLPVSVGKVDRAVLSQQAVQKLVPLAKPTLIETAVDARRLRALVIRNLELSALAGDTLKPREKVVVALRDADCEEDEHRTLATVDLLSVAEEETFDDEVRLIKMSDGKMAYQLGRFSNVGSIIRNKINKRINADRLSLPADWEKELASSLPALPENAEERSVEERARKEKVAALAELASSRFSVLIGGAGTGKTTLLSILCKRPEINSGRILLLAPTGKRRPDALFFTGDLGQRIFQQPFSWQALGVDVRGRCRTLKVNYRTSHQIRMQADRLLEAEVTDVDGNIERRDATISMFNGPAPEIAAAENQKDESRIASEWLAARLKEGLNPQEIGIFVRSDTQIDRAKEIVLKTKQAFKILDETVETAPGKISICTMHLAKGLEFRAVAVIACDDEILPLQERIESVSDDADLKEVYDTERQLLYVACTRARDYLLLTGIKPASEFFDDLSQSS